ncbi:MAG: glutamyl-tRNA reductase [Deltaproteobacteria bacterium]|nr:glutamyl-tRNA reductase [Deltaproteobacteria bacterium]
MTKILDIGMNHETAPVEIRECMAREPGIAQAALDEMRQLSCVREGLYLSTCNRVEALVITEEPQEARKCVLSLMARLGGIGETRFASNLYTLEDRDAVRHIFRVASSLDSMVVGEPQILGQIKQAYAQAAREKTSGVILNRLMHKAFHVAKRVRTETGVSDSAVSVSYAAVEMAKKIFHDLRGKGIFLVGAGEMAELAAKHLVKNGADTLLVANRTFERAVEMADAFAAKAVAFEEIESLLQEADIVITSTAAGGYVVTHDQVRGCLRKRRNRPLFLVDIAVPRNVEPRVNDLGNVYLYDIDDLRAVTELNKAQRQEEALKAERIVEEEVVRFDKWLKTLHVVPTIVSLKEKAEAIRRAEIKRSLGNLGGLSPSQIEVIETLTLSITEKIINDPILVLKRKADRPTRDNYLDMARRLFNLDSDYVEENVNGLEPDDSDPQETS